MIESRPASGTASPPPLDPGPGGHEHEREGVRLALPELSLVVLIGVSSSGKSTFARQHFLPTEVLSSDACRALVSDDENSLDATNDAFEVLHTITAKRLARGRLTVIDATNVQPEARRPLVALAREHYVQPVAIVFDLPEKLCQERSRARPDRNFGAHVIRRQAQSLRRSLRGLGREGFRHVYVLRSPEDVASGVVERQRLRTNRSELTGPFDIIGDIHGCFDELVGLLRALDYQVDTATDVDGQPSYAVQPPPGRRAIFLGDLVDRGPRSPDVLRLVMSMVTAGTALCVVGNHDDKLRRKLTGRDVQVAHGLAETLAQLEREPSDFRERVAAIIDDLTSHYVLDGGKLVVAHAGLKAEMQGRATSRVRDFAMYGETTGEIDCFGLPVRLNWAADYRGKAMVVYGHTAVPQPEWVNNTIDVDTGCVFGGRLTALRYPEKELVSVPAAQVYYAPAHPLSGATLSVTGAAADNGVEPTSRLQPRAAVLTGESETVALAEAPAEGEASIGAKQVHAAAAAPGEVTTAATESGRNRAADLLDVGDVLGRHVVETRLHHPVTIREEQSAAALEVLSRFASDPRWLIYLPPTMSPTETSREPGLLEHPAEAFAYYRREGVAKVICEEKHMGSRAVLVVCRDEEVAHRRFGITPIQERADHSGATGICYTRTGRHFFENTTLQQEFLARVGRAIQGADLWRTLETDWLCLDAELMPWSVKAQALLQQQYAAVGAAARAALPAAVRALGDAAAREGDAGPATGLLERYRQRLADAERFVDVYRRYCWPVTSLDDLKLAPFHLLASEGRVHIDKGHRWHMELLSQLAAADPQLCVATAHRVVTLDGTASVQEAIRWWEELTKRGSEGMVMKPLDFVARGRRGLLQPAIKCRGREYLRLIYGPEYTEPDHLERLRQRGLAAKRSLALREFALGIEGMQRFVEGAPLYRVHQCVFGVLALESEPVDPRL